MRRRLPTSLQRHAEHGALNHIRGSLAIGSDILTVQLHARRVQFHVYTSAMHTRCRHLCAPQSQYAGSPNTPFQVLTYSELEGAAGVRPTGYMITGKRANVLISCSAVVIGVRANITIPAGRLAIGN